MSLFKNIRTAKIILIISLVVFVFYSVGYLIGDIYKYPIVGAIYELLSLLMLLFLLVIPIVSVLIIVKNYRKGRVYAALSILLMIGSIIIMTQSK